MLEILTLLCLAGMGMGFDLVTANCTTRDDFIWFVFSV